MTPRSLRPAVLAGVALLAAVDAAVVAARALQIAPQVTLTNPAADDQDDFCIWAHPTDPSLSTIIASDKFADRIFVYDLEGDLLQTLDVTADPGNIDVRKRFPFQGELIDIAVVNNRSKSKLFVYRVLANGTLSRIDRNDLDCSDSYGLCMYKSGLSGSFYVFTTDKSGNVRQFELYDSGSGLAIDLVRSWSYGSITEGCVADDTQGKVYFANEQVAVWKVGAEPDDPAPGEKIARVGTDGLAADVEGLALFKGPRFSGYLIATSQGNSTFKVYDRAAPHDFVETVTVTGASATDGIDIYAGDLGPDFPHGLFAVHTNSGSPKAILLCALEDLDLPLQVDLPDNGSVPPTEPTDAPETAGALSALSPVVGHPNPFRGLTQLRFTTARDATVSLFVVDSSGRRVARLLHRSAVGAGPHALDWNGTDDAGRALPAGVYFYRLESEHGAASGKTTLLR